MRSYEPGVTYSTCATDGRPSWKALDLFAGPGGWDEGLRPLGIAPLGVEWDDAACATRRAAGHPTLQADVAKLDPQDFAGTDLLLASPPCQAFSLAGKGRGRANAEAIVDLAVAVQRGDTWGEKMARQRVEDERALLVVEPLRFALELRPRFVAFEQVPPVLPLWEQFAHYLRAVGYSTWTGKLSAEQYGVPQTRKRAILMASLDGPVAPPATTHTAYKKGEPAVAQDGLLPWVSMAEALGWGATERPYATLAGGTAGGPCYDFVGGSGARRQLLTERSEGRWLNPGRTATQPNRRLYHEDEPAPTIAFGHDVAAWRWEAENGVGPIRLTFAEAGVLQGFPADYPWQGTRTAQAVQVGNAFPPPLACAVVSALTGREEAAL